MSSNKLWKAAGKPHNGPIYDQHKSDKLAYKLRLKDEIQPELSCYSNDLHEALLEKAGTDFWNCWRSKFGDKMQLPVSLTDWLTNLPSLQNLLSILSMSVGVIVRLVVVSLKKGILTLDILTLEKLTWSIIILMSNL